MQGISAQVFVQIVVYHIQHLLQFMQRLPQIDQHRKMQEVEIEHFDVEQKDSAKQNAQLTECKKQKMLKEYKGSDRPKNPISSFVFYFREQLQRRDHPSNEKQIGKLAKIASEQWKALSEQAKQPYRTKAQQRNQAYEQSMKKQNILHAEGPNLPQKVDATTNNKQDCMRRAKKYKKQGELIRRKSKKQKPKQPELDIGIPKPKAPLSSFFIFFKESTARLSHLHQENRRPKLVHLASLQWKELSKQQKQTYKAIAKTHKAAYQNQLAAYNSRACQFLKNQTEKNIQMVNQPQKADISRKNIENQAQNIAKEQDHYDSEQDANKKQPDSLGEDMPWAMLTQTQKEIYQQEAKRGRELYEVEMEKFKKEYPEEASKLKYFQSKKEK